MSKQNWTMTDGGAAIITHDLGTIGILGDKDEPRTGICLGLLESGNKSMRHAVWCLFFERGGDWSVFPEDNTEFDSWDAECCETAIERAVEKCPDCDEDMQWFRSWTAEVRARE